MPETDPHARARREVRFRFYAELNDFLPEARRQREFGYGFAGTPSVKDAIEAIGVPHTEIDVILVDGRPLDFSRGRRLERNRGVVASNGLVHDAVIEAIRRVS